MRRLDINASIRVGNGRYSAGHGLSLRVAGNSALWEYQFRDRTTKRTRTVSIGPAKGDGALNVTDARDTRDRVRLAHRGATNGHAPRAALAVAAGVLFGDAVSAFIATHSPSWKGGSEGDEAQAYRRTLLGLAKLPVAAIDTGAIEQHLAPWNGRPTSEKVRTKIKSILDYATAKGWRTGDNPAARAIMKNLLPAIAPAVNHPSLPWQEVPAYMRELAAMNSTVARALSFTILTAARAGETHGATWSEIQGDTWAIPGERMKEGKAHRVPLSSQALALLGKRGADGARIFPELAQGTMGDLARVRGVTCHGFRTSMTTWAQEQDDGRMYPDPVIKAAIAHNPQDNESDAAYLRSAHFAARRKMMANWTAFATGA
jgi:integrase